MNAPTSPAVAEQSHPVEAKVGKLVEQESSEARYSDREWFRTN